MEIQHLELFVCIMVLSDHLFIQSDQVLLQHFQRFTFNLLTRMFEVIIKSPDNFLKCY